MFILFGTIIHAITVSSNGHVHRHVCAGNTVWYAGNTVWYAGNNFLLEHNVIATLDSTHILAGQSRCSIYSRMAYYLRVWFKSRKYSTYTQTYIHTHTYINTYVCTNQWITSDGLPLMDYH